MEMNRVQNDDEILSEIERKDEMYQRILIEQQERQLGLIRQKKGELLRLNRIQKLRSSGMEGSIQVFGAGYSGYGNGWTGVKPRMLYPNEQRNMRSRVKRFKMETMLLQSQCPELLVPVRIEMDSDKYRLRDTFTWNLHEVSISPEQFAEPKIAPTSFNMFHLSPELPYTTNIINTAHPEEKLSNEIPYYTNFSTGENNCNNRSHLYYTTHRLITILQLIMTAQSTNLWNNI
ncbi:hypothetical protein PCK2_000657 [Pneumocystis canis]|nr:hypothetical protein PCK2_000657 [Pneumocystis canis]